MKIKQLLLLTIATLCCTTAFAFVPMHYEDSIYAGETYLFNDTLLTTEGTFVRTVPRIGGGDSLAEVTLHFISPCKDIEVAYDDSIYEGETYLFLDTLLMLEGTYTRTIPRIANCGDSIIHLTLSWISVPTCEDIEVAYDDSIYEGEAYLFLDTLLMLEGTYTRTIPRIANCGDSIIHLTLSWISVPTCEDIEVAYDDSVYLGETYLFIDSLITPADYTPVVVTKTIPRIAGCDSTITLTLYIMQPCKDTAVAYTDSIYVGESYLFNDTLITLNEIDTITCQRTLLREGTTCDSVINLTLFSMYRYRRDTLTADTIRQSLCYQEAFTDRLGVTYYPTQDTIIHDTVLVARIDTVVPTITTIDSVYIYKLTINPTYNVSDPIVKCESELPFVWNGETIASASDNGKQVTLKTINECDSVVTLALTVYPIYDVTETITKCESELPFVWNGETIASASDNGKQVTLKTINECDSVVTLSLTVNPTYNVSDPIVKCESELPFVWNGITIASASDNGKQVTLKTINECDSVVTLSLTINPTYNVSDPIVKCESELPFVWNGETIASASDNGKQVTLKTINECDSVVTLSLTINPTYNVSDPIVKCASELPFVWNGETIASASDNGKQVTLKTINECDSVVTLALTVYPIYDVTETITKCASELPFDWNGITIASASDNGKQVTLKTINECDSVVTLALTVLSAYVDSLPALVKDESWLLMINRRSINDYGIDFTADQVHWYRVEGEVDQYPYGEKNDVFVGTGDYYTIAQKLSGRYYAILDGVDISAYGPCVKIARTVVLNCDQRQSKALRLLPSLVTLGQPMTLNNIDATGESEITILNADGTVMHRFRVSGTDKFQMHANGVPGMYMMHVQNSSQRSTLKYIVKP